MMRAPQKPTKWGMCVFVLADCETGYVSAIVPYFGSPTTDSMLRPDMLFSSRIVLHLCETLLQTTNGHGFHLFTDRFDTGSDLATELLKIKIHLTGTVMANRRGLPVPVKQGLIEQGQQDHGARKEGQKASAHVEHLPWQ
ncbi:UNVERIFIED_CONTAM: hypothetical protein FKN15_005071 [Acipenser sinensis]